MESNGTKVSFADKEVYDIGMKLASDQMTREELYKIIKEHVK